MASRQRKGAKTAKGANARSRKSASKAAAPAAAKKKPAKKAAARAAAKAAAKKSRAAKQVGSAKANSGSTKSTAAKKHPTKIPPLPSAVERLRKVCLALPETTEVEAWGEPTFRVKGKIFAMHASTGNHHGAGRPAVWILSVSMEQDMVLRARPDRYFKPPYVGPSGWIGAWLDNNPPWGEIEELLRDGWRRRAPKKVAALLPD
jgi:hypothetical protein